MNVETEYIGGRLGRTALPLAAVVAIAAMLCAGCGSSAEEEIQTIQNVPVEIAIARRGPIESHINITGVVAPAPDAELLVTAPQAARVGEIYKAAGEPVRRGELVVRFDIPSLDAEAATAAAGVQRALAAVENARAEKERLDGLFERGIAARKELEDARRDLADAEAGLDEARIGVEAANALRSRRDVRSPFDGVVAERWHNPGDLVEPGPGDPILRVIDPTRLEVRAAVPVESARMIHVGSPARVTAGAEIEGSTDWNAKVISAPASIDPATSTGTVRVSIDRGTGLVTGTPVVVDIQGDVNPDALVVPSSAIVREGEELFLYIVADTNIARRKKITAGTNDGDSVEILSGITEGERVIVSGGSTLPDGATVSIAGGTGAP